MSFSTPRFTIRWVLIASTLWVGGVTSSLASPPAPTGDNLVWNGSFEELDGRTGAPVHWAASGATTVSVAKSSSGRFGEEKGLAGRAA
jgi:hypothetical protein